MKRTGHRKGLRTGAIALLVLLAAGSGCKDRIAAPTQGFIEITTAGASGVEVFLDGESQGVKRRLGPLDEGMYAVTVFRDGYEVVPGTPSEVAVEVEGGRTRFVSFSLELLGPGSVLVSSVDEIIGDDVTGAAIDVDKGEGFEPTGQVTPATVSDLPPGAVGLRLRKAGFADREMDVTILKFQTVNAEVPLGPPHAVLAEMTTWTTCSGCPESADKLHEMQQAAPEHFYVIEWHRRGPGWPLYHAPSLNREAFYGTGGVAPSVVFQGGSDASQGPAVLIGSEGATLLQYETRYEAYLDVCDSDCSLALKVMGDFQAAPGDSVEADVRVLYRGGSLPSGLVLWIVLSEDHIPENYVGGDAGTTDEFSYVARKSVEIPVVFGTPGEIQQFVHRFAVDDADWFPSALDPPNNFHLTAWVQSGGTGVSGTHEILAVGGL